jgi:hypothetical protein
MADDADTGDTGWQPPPGPAPAQPPGPPSGGPSYGGPGRILGEARGVQARSEQDPLVSQRQLTVVSFRVERYDEAGNRLAPVAVQMRGQTFEGAVSEGDWVEVTGGKVRDGTVQVDRVRNLTTNVVVRAKGADHSPIYWIVVGVMVLIVAGVALVAILIIGAAMGGVGAMTF